MKLYAEKTHPDLFCKEDFLKNFANFLGKYLRLGFFCNKFVVNRPANLSNKDSSCVKIRAFS